jgi:hypothetical protein
MNNSIPKVKSFKYKGIELQYPLGYKITYDFASEDLKTLSTLYKPMACSFTKGIKYL